MKIKIIKIIKAEEEVDIEFPIYREHDVSQDGHPSNIIFSKIEFNDDTKKMICQNIRISDHNNEIEMEVDMNYHFDGSGSDYLLGTGMYESTEKDFNEALTKAKNLIRFMNDIN